MGRAKASVVTSSVTREVKEELFDLPGTDMWVRGQCAAWAINLVERIPELELAIQYELMTEEDSRREAEEDGEEWDGERLWQAQHVLAHDDKYAYDAAGKYNLPVEDWDDTEYGLSKNDVEDTGLLENGYTDSADSWLNEINYLELAGLKPELQKNQYCDII